MIIKVKLTDMFSADPKIKYACAKNVLALAGENPERLYGDLEFFVSMLDNQNNILRWTAIDVIGALARVDRDNVLPSILNKIIELLNTGNMITANHAIAALADIAVSRPELQAQITGELLNVEHYEYDSVECRNIALGKVILAVGKYFTELQDKKPALEFIIRQTRNTRIATRKKAEQFLHKYNARN
jgi:hypothetical protein